MIFELSKDRSLLNLLSKIELDKETSKLVKANASISSIRKSLENNINSSNLIQYRKYILKATKEEEEAEKDRLQSEEEDTKIIDDEYAHADIEREKKLESAKYGAMVSRQDSAKAAYKYLSVLQYQVADLEKISETARVKSDKTVIGARQAYAGFGNNKGSSVKVINLLHVLTNKKDYLTNLFASELVNGILPGKKYSKDKDTKRVNVAEDKESKNIDVKDLQTRINALLKTSFPIENSEETMKFYDVIVKLHTQRHKYEPKTIRDESRRKHELQGAQAFLQGKNPKIASKYKKALTKFKSMMDDITKINKEKKLTLEKIEELEEIEKNVDKIVKNKLRKLLIGLNAVINQGQYKHKSTGKTISTKEYNRRSKDMQQFYTSVLSPEYIQEQTASIKDIQANPEKYLEEGRQEINEDIEIEKVKLEKFVEDLEVFDKLKEPLVGYKRIISRYVQDTAVMAEEVAQPPNIIKEKITIATGIVIKMRQKVKVLVRLSAGVSDDIDRGLVDTLLGSEDAKLTIESDGLDFQGMPTIDADKIINVDEASSQYQELVQKLQEIVNEINHMIDGGETK